MSHTCPSAPRAGDAASVVRPRRRISRVLVSLAIAAVAALMSFAPGHVSGHDTRAIADTAGIDTLPGGATTNQFAGGRVPPPPQPV
jgi:hypothetical protein